MKTSGLWHYRLGYFHNLLTLDFKIVTKALCSKEDPIPSPSLGGSVRQKSHLLIVSTIAAHTHTHLGTLSYVLPGDIYVLQLLAVVHSCIQGRRREF